MNLDLLRKPTVVLVHGAFADSSSWNGVIERLRRDGYPVLAAANPLRGLQEDAAYVRSVLDSVSGPIVLAGHSYGGSVMSEAADGHPNVKALVYISSFQLEVGESTADLANKFPGNELGAALRPVPFPLPGGGTGNDLYIENEEFRRVFAADVPRKETELMAATQRPITEAALQGKATRAAWKSIPSWHLIARQDLAIPPESMRFMAKRAGAQIVEVDASHAVAVSEPGAVADVIDKVGRTVTK
ncbi:alpha/beta hydrolase [Actinomadura sp. GC306]|uniref:alpha/beta fold hydrolase n=1 Tax=Actinomadura sp. GC306 TaxID=2530367 RepID=UPI0010518CE5|nr:alpha/beta hydrolase [Actinomadura sp. GC306]TDC69193.1 alpha/beta hydrolase [Actinomadura sp. GC306]